MADGQEVEQGPGWRGALLLTVFASICMSTAVALVLSHTAREGQSVDPDTSVEWQAVLFLAVLVFQLVLNVTFSIPVVCVFFLRRLEALRCRRGLKEYDLLARGANSDDMEAGNTETGADEITAIIPCYLPNEQDIIEGTLTYILQNLEAPGELVLWLVYNTSEDMPEVEGRLLDMAARNDLPHGRRLVVSRCRDSGSKAENLNSALSQITSKYVAIYDADHHPDPGSLLMLYHKLRANNLDCVQGSTYIRNLDQGGALGRFVDAEFFFNYFMNQPSARFLTKIAYFGGSNALWSREALSALGFRKDMQTEDIDVSFRAIVENRRIDLCPEAQSGELAPASMYAFFRQRMRWTVGWDQVSLDLFGKLRHSKASLPTNVGVIHLLYVRWFNIIAGFAAGVVVPILHAQGRLNIGRHSVLGMAASELQFGVFILFASSGFCMICEGIIHAWFRNWRFSQIPVLIVFLLSGSIYATYQLLMVGVSLTKIVLGKTGEWYVSPRRDTESAARAQEPSSAAEPLVIMNAPL
mmetsp:Transcript_51601/g.95503  ORF Transcript_51601/g.95503 Transcript_51601/m.95503 type:complete len:525 (+) Transcript_51601:71-1645(+)